MGARAEVLGPTIEDRIPLGEHMHSVIGGGDREVVSTLPLRGGLHARKGVSTRVSELDQVILVFSIANNAPIRHISQDAMHSVVEAVPVENSLVSGISMSIMLLQLTRDRDRSGDVPRMK